MGLEPASAGLGWFQSHSPASAGCHQRRPALLGCGCGAIRWVPAGGDGPGVGTGDGRSRASSSPLERLKGDAGAGLRGRGLLGLVRLGVMGHGGYREERAPGKPPEGGGSCGGVSPRGVP